MKNKPVFQFTVNFFSPATCLPFFPEEYLSHRVPMLQASQRPTGCKSSFMWKLLHSPLTEYLFITLSIALMHIKSKNLCAESQTQTLFQGQVLWDLSPRYQPFQSQHSLYLEVREGKYPQQSPSWNESAHVGKMAAAGSMPRHNISSVHHISLHLLSGFFCKSLYIWCIGILGSGRASDDLPILSPLYFS